MSGDNEGIPLVPETVQLTIRCAFQTLEDQTVEASTSWTVKQLKEHIRDADPTHPVSFSCFNYFFKDTTTLKLIYGGHCLQDERILKNIFEQVYNTLSCFYKIFL